MSDACDQIIVDVGYLPSGGHFLLALNSRYGNDGNHVQKVSASCKLLQLLCTFNNLLSWIVLICPYMLSVT